MTNVVVVLLSNYKKEQAHFKSSEQFNKNREVLSKKYTLYLHIFNSQDSSQHVTEITCTSYYVCH